MKFHKKFYHTIIIIKTKLNLVKKINNNKREQTMATEILKGLKIIFLLQFITMTFFGIFFFFFIEAYVVLFSWPYLDPIAGHYIGAFSLGIAVLAILAYRETEWDRIELLVIFHIVWILLGLIAMIWGLVTDFTFAGTFNSILLVFFLVAFTYFYLQQRK